MIERATREYSDEEIRACLEPEVAAWFQGAFPQGFTPPQRYAVAELHAGRNVLISSPTGSGKTLSGFLAAINELVALSKRGELEDRVHVVYVSPLKALNNDIERNLQGPLQGIQDVFRAKGETPPEIRVGVRTGDTPQRERQAQTKRPPHVLITTPETLAILLCAPKFSDHLAGARWVIVDELHALAENKRGSHLALSLERLHRSVEASGRAPPTRVGLSATISPLDEMARFLVGPARPCLVVDVQYLKQVDLQVLSPVADLVTTPPEEMTESLYRLLDDLIESHRTTLIFTNTRAGTERVVHQLKQKFGRKYADLGAPPPRENSEDPAFVPPEQPLSEGTNAGERSFVAAHHGSMSRETRLEVEEALKRGELKCVVCSTSLELGIDIGYVDLVILLGSPKGIARALQRVGRSGHKIGALSKGRIIALDRDELVEATVLAELARERKLDAISIPKAPLDVLCQHILGLAIEQRWRAEDALALVRSSYPYADLSEEDFLACLEYLAGEHPALEGRRVYGKVWYDRATGEFGRRGSMARVIYSTNIGTIPDTTSAKVMEGNRYVGEVSEEFLENLVAGDVFMLGGHTWQFRHASGLKAYVGPADGRRPTVPQWSSEQLPLAKDLAREVRAFRAEIGRRLTDNPLETTIDYVQNAYHVDRLTSEAICGYLREQARFGGIPEAEEVLVEEFVDDDLQRNYVFHTLRGRRTNEALSRAFAKRVAEVKGVNVRVQASDNGFVLVVPRSAILTATDVKGLFLMDVRGQVLQAIEGSEILRRRFRHVATRALLLLRNYGGRSRTVGRQQVNSTILYHVIRRADPDFPVIREALREVTEDAFDLADAEAVAFAIASKQGRVRIERSLKAPTPFAHNLVALGSRDTVLMEDRKRLVRDLHARVRELLEERGAT